MFSFFTFSVQPKKKKGPGEPSSSSSEDSSSSDSSFHSPILEFTAQYKSLIKLHRDKFLNHLKGAWFILKISQMEAVPTALHFAPEFGWDAFYCCYQHRYLADELLTHYKILREIKATKSPAVRKAARTLVFHSVMPYLDKDFITLIRTHTDGYFIDWILGREYITERFIAKNVLKRIIPAGYLLTVNNSECIPFRPDRLHYVIANINKDEYIDTVAKVLKKPRKVDSNTDRTTLWLGLPMEMQILILSECLLSTGVKMATTCRKFAASFVGDWTKLLWRQRTEVRLTPQDAREILEDLRPIPPGTTDMHRMWLDGLLYHDLSGAQEGFGQSESFECATEKPTHSGPLQWTWAPGARTRAPVWMLGMVTFLLLTGVVPVAGKDRWKDARFDRLSKSAQDFLMACLDSNGPTTPLLKLLDHEFLKKGASREKLDISLDLEASWAHFKTLECPIPNTKPCFSTKDGVFVSSKDLVANQK